MPTIRWSDLNCTETAGKIMFKDMLISVGPKHIDCWKDDPDGRFAMAVRAQVDGNKTADLVKFYPSL